MPARDRRPIRRDAVPTTPRPAQPAPDRRSAAPPGWEPVPPAGPSRAPSRRPGAQAPAPATLATSTVLTRALLPLRLFFGGTFLYAGIDKLIDPTFLRGSGPGSIGEQLASFERVSPIAALVHLGDPFPVVVGLLIALLEIAVGLGALLGLLFRPAAVFGAGLSFLFFLTASWGTHPYYYGADLPYAFGWLTLAIAGHGHLWTVEDWLTARDAGAGAAGGMWPSRPGPAYPRRSTTPPMFTDRERRAFLQLGLLAIASIAVGGLSGLWGLRERAEGGEGRVPRVSPSAAAAPSPGASAAAASAGASSAPAASSANLIGSLNDLKSQGALMFQDPSTGDPGIVVDVGGKVLGYDAVCTHQGCTVEYDPQAVMLVCPCHGAEFDPARSAEVVAGPARAPLASFPLTIQNGNIYLKA